MMDDGLRRLATYGTLAPGRPNHGQVAALRGTWSRGWVRGRLYDQGWGAAQGFPGLVLGPGPEIAVDLLHADDLPDHWARLDAFEGAGYRRVVTEVATEAGIVRACIYVLAEG